MKVSKSGSMADNTKEVEAEKIIPTVELPIILPLVVTDLDREMAHSATQDFEQGNYASCLTTMKNLLGSRPQDVKVYHNVCVAEYYLSNFRKTEEFRNNMIDVCKQANINIDNVDALDDVDHCVVFFNQAVVLYHLHQYRAALSILDKIFQFIEPLEETLAVKVCFLLLELYLCTHQPEKAHCVIAYIEAMLFSGSKTNNNEKSGDKENDTKEENSSNDILKPRLQQYKARCYLMMKTPKACKREIKSLMSSGSVNISVFYLKSQLEYQRGNYRKAMKVLSSAAVPENMTQHFHETGDCIPAVYYNNLGCINFYMGKPNLGCMYFNKAIQEYENVIKQVTDGIGGGLSARPLHTMTFSIYYQLMYNLGLQYLHAGKFHRAFDCLLKAMSNNYHTNPRLWLRLAECCIQIHKSDNSKDFQLSQKKKDMVQHVVGSGPHRKIVLSPSLSKVSSTSIPDQLTLTPSPTLEYAYLCLRNALSLLPDDPPAVVRENSTPPSQKSSEDQQENNHSQENNHTLLALPVGYIQENEISNLRNSILAAISYVALCVADTILAHKYALLLLSQPKISGVHNFLAHLYAGEALILMDRIAEAIDHLKPEHIKDIMQTFPVSSDETKTGEKMEETNRPTGHIQSWFPNTLSTARMITQYNLTVAFTLRGEWDKASESLRQQVGAAKSPGTDIPVQALMLAIYIQLQQGFADMAKSIIKQHLPQYR